jgi:hypothetical protein
MNGVGGARRGTSYDCMSACVLGAGAFTFSKVSGSDLNNCRGVLLLVVQASPVHADGSVTAGPVGWMMMMISMCNVNNDVSSSIVCYKQGCIMFAYSANFAAAVVWQGWWLHLAHTTHGASP